MKKVSCAAYYFPNYHQDTRNEEVHGKGWNEWELMKCARPRFEGHQQPKLPLWGMENEADPMVMAKKIDAAAEAGIDAFVFDWYWYDGPYLERALNEGFLQAPNRNKMKFALMWANHDWYDRHPIGRKNAWEPPLLYQWASTPENIHDVWTDIVERYFTQPNYWTVDGLPYFSIYAVNRFITQMGGVETTAEVLADLRKVAMAHGLPGVHINGVWYDNLDSSPTYSACPQNDWARKVGFSSYTSYNCSGATPIWQREELTIDYLEAGREYLEMAAKASGRLPAPYYPVLTAGWDSSPRTIQSDKYYVGPYPYIPVMQPTPEAFRMLLTGTLKLLENRPAAQQVFFINAWNEWTEGSYLEPDTQMQYTYLNILKELLK